MGVLERVNIEGGRSSLSMLGAVVAEVDRELRYRWIDNPHPDFEPSAVVGKRDDELISSEEAKEIMSLKSTALDSGEPVSRVLVFNRTDGWRYYSLFAYPIREFSGEINSILTIGFDVEGQEIGLGASNVRKKPGQRAKCSNSRLNRSLTPFFVRPPGMA